MKNIQRILAIVLAVLFALTAFAACGSTQDGAESAAAPENKKMADDVSAQEAPVSGGKLIMATNASFPPYEFKGDSGEIEGIDAEIAAKIAEKLGLEIEIMDVDFGSIIAGVQSGKFDIGMAGMTVNEERLQSVNFSTPYATGVQVIIVPEGSEIAGPDDLGDAMIGVQQDTTGHIYAEGDYGKDHVQPYKTGNDAVQALVSGKVDAVIIDNEPAKSYVETNSGLKILDTEYTVEDYAIAIAKENTDLLDKVNAALAELTEDGTIDAIITKYIPA